VVQSIFRGEREQADDLRLLRRYAADGCARSFETVVRRHIGWVYSSSLRQVGDAHLAEDVTQAVFVLLARRAATLHDDTLLTGWLFNTLRFTAREARRKEARRRKHESAAALAPQTPAPEGIDRQSWEAMAPLLDEAVGSLKESDRQALLLRFYEGREFVDIARILGLTEPAARKRVSRAVERLGRFFKKRGIARPTALILALVLLTRSSEAAPLVPLTAELLRRVRGPFQTSPPAATLQDSSRAFRTPRQIVTTLVAGIALLALLTTLVAWLADAPPAIDPHDFASPGAIDTWSTPAGQTPLTHTLELPAIPLSGRPTTETPPAAPQADDPPAHPLAGVDAFWWVRQWFNPANAPATAQARRSLRSDPATNSIDPATGQPRAAPGTHPQDYVESYAQMGGGGGSAPAATPRPLGPVAGEVNGATASRGAPAPSTSGDVAVSSHIAAVVETIAAGSSESATGVTLPGPVISGQLTPLTVADNLVASRYIRFTPAGTGMWILLPADGSNPGASIHVIRRYLSPDGSADVVLVEGPATSDVIQLAPAIVFASSGPTQSAQYVFGPVAPITSDTGFIAYAQTPEPGSAVLLIALALPLTTRRHPK
jgi:RNA polymerase sigma factor (sigma-70 family)